MASIANTATLSTNLNVDPYYDDFSESKNFHRVLFRPGLAVQARELTQMQSILQNQIDRFAEHMFKEGSIVRGCEMNLDQRYYYVKLRDNNSTGSSVNAAAFLNKTVKGTTSGVRAIINNTTDGAQANTPNFKSFYVKYTAANTSGAKFFSNNEILTATDGSGITANTITAAQGGATGHGSAITIASGIVFAKDHFIRVDEQTLILERYSANATFRIGLDINESIVTDVGDTTLLDPASGAFNYAAPGATRLKIVAALVKKTTTENTANNFIELMQIKGGIIQSRSDKPEYAALKDYIARRTYDESGNYIVHGLSLRLRENLYSANNQGVYTAAQGGNTSVITIDVQPGKAYVQGYDIETLVSRRVNIRKGIDYQSLEQVKTLVDYGNYVVVDNVAGAWDINGQDTVTLRGQQANAISTRSYSTTSYPASSIGTARVRALEYYSGTPGLPSAQYKMYLTDIKLTTANKSFANVQFIGFTAGGSSANGKADIVGSNGLNANTADPSFDRAVYKLPVYATRRLRDTSGNIDTDFTFNKSFDISFDATGQATLTTGDNSERLAGSGTLSDAATMSNYYIVSRSAANTSTLTGTVSVTNGSNTVTGSGTAFTTQVNPGDLIRIANTGTTNFLVSTVTSATIMNLINAPTVTKTGMPFHKRFIQGQILDLGGVGRDGTRSIAVSGSPTTTSLIDLNETLNSPSTLTATAIVKLTKADGQEAAKTVARSKLVQVRIGNAAAGNSYAGNTSGPWPLGLSDGFKLVSVRKQSGSNFASLTAGSDVTSNFILDSGMRDNFYDHARLVKKSGSGLTISSGDRLLVKLDHFTHSYSSGVGYLSVDSYPVNDTTAGTDTTKIFTYEIPVYTSPSDGLSFDLRDSIDIRPRMTDTANSVTALANISVNPLVSTSFDEPSGGLHFSPPQQDLTADLDYYLERKDVIVLDKNGSFRSVTGVPSLFPRAPAAPAEGIVLAEVSLAPYPSLPSEIARRVGRPDMSNGVYPVKNSRFTMRDIGVIKDRVDNLEYYTALSLLEGDTNALIIQDDNGLDRFKNGIIADSFTGHKIGNVYDSDYKIAIDPSKGEARPPFALNNLELFHHTANSSNVVRTNVTTGGISRDQTVLISNSQVLFSNNEILTSGASTATLRYQVNNKLYIEAATGNFAAAASVVGGTSGRTATISSTITTTVGDLLTLPYTHEILVDQKYGTTTRNAAGAFYNWAGALVLDPAEDYWVDTTIAPAVQVNFDLNTDNWLHLANSWQTQWGAWNTVWTGQNLSGATSTSTSGVYTSGRQILQDFTVSNELVTTTGLSRTGITPSVTVQNTTQSLGNTVRDVNLQPYMRSRVVRFTAHAVKPSTRLYAFFDGTSVSGYVTPTNSSFANTANEGGILTSDSTGKLYGTFRVPNDNSLRFHTGSRNLRFTDNPTNAQGLGLLTTSAEATYTAQGLATTAQDTIVATRQPVISQTTSTQTTTTTTSNWIQVGGGTNVVGTIPDPPPPTPADPPAADNGGSWFDFGGGADGGGGGGSSDPISQTFLVNTSQSSRISGTGAFITKIDLFFSTKDSALPVIVEIREVDPATGYPTLRAVPYGQAIVASSLINTSTDGSKPTPFYFPAPVYLLNDRSYAVVVIPGAVNPNYRVFTARIGDNDILTGNRVTSQPASGMMWISSDDRAYSAVQEEDMKYRLYMAKFNKAVTGTIVVKNENRDYLTVANQSAALRIVGEQVHGVTLLRGIFANTKTLSVANNTTFAQGFVSGATGIVTSFAAAQIDIRDVTTAAKFKGGERIRFRTNNATTGGIVGNSTGGITSATTPIGFVTYYDAVNYANTHLHLSNTSFINSGAAYTSNRMFTNNTFIRGQSNGYTARIVAMNRLQGDVFKFTTDYLQPSNTTISASTKMALSNSTRDTSDISININTDTELNAPRYILSRSVESNTSASSSSFASSRSAEFKITIKSTSDLASPAVDLRRTSLCMIENLINSNTTIGSSEDGVKTGGNAKARYISRRVTLADGQDAEDLRVYVTAYKPSGAGVHVYYKALNREDSDTFADSKWIPMAAVTDAGFTSAARYSSSEDTEDFIELAYQIDSYSNTYKSGANTTNGIIEYRNTLGARYTGFKYFAIKIVLTHTTSTRPPRIRDFRAIALQI